MKEGSSNSALHKNCANFNLLLTANTTIDNHCYFKMLLPPIISFLNWSPFVLSKSSYVPFSVIRPPLKTATWSQNCNTLFLCVMNKTIERLLSLLSRRKRSWFRKSCSAGASRADEASSIYLFFAKKRWWDQVKILNTIMPAKLSPFQIIRKLFRHSPSTRILGFVNKALAMLNLCFCPPLTLAPLSPTIVS